MVLHKDQPCKTCAKDAECLAAIEYSNVKDDPGKVSLIASEAALSDLLKRQKLSGKEKAAILAAKLVQALSSSKGKAVEAEKAELKPDGEGSKATFEYKKAKAVWLVHVALDKEGGFTGLTVEDSGRSLE
jgi:hypothetical protein